MIESVTITNHLNESIELVLTEPEESGFVIRSIEGLGPVNANVHFTELATLDGAIDNDARLGTRNIVLSLVFIGKPTIENTRQLSYKYFPIKQKILFRIKTTNRECYTVGRVESNVPNIFDQQEGCQISILCPDSYFKSLKDGTVSFYGVEPLFEFPFSNESLVEPLIEFGDMYTISSGEINYQGDGETGILINIYANGSAEGLTIQNAKTRQMLSISDSKLISLTGAGISKGDNIIIDTTKGNKSVLLIRDGQTINILNALEKPISWINLNRGSNIFTFTADSGLNYLKYVINYNSLYEGV